MNTDIRENSFEIDPNPPPIDEFAAEFYLPKKYIYSNGKVKSTLQ